MKMDDDRRRLAVRSYAAAGTRACLSLVYDIVDRVPGRGRVRSHPPTPSADFVGARPRAAMMSSSMTSEDADGGSARFFSPLDERSDGGVLPDDQGRALRGWRRGRERSRRSRRGHGRRRRHVQLEEVRRLRRSRFPDVHRVRRPRQLRERPTGGMSLRVQAPLGPRVGHPLRTVHPGAVRPPRPRHRMAPRARDARRVSARGEVFAVDRHRARHRGVRRARGDRHRARAEAHLRPAYRVGRRRHLHVHADVPRPSVVRRSKARGVHGESRGRHVHLLRRSDGHAGRGRRRRGDRGHRPSRHPGRPRALHRHLAAGGGGDAP